MSALDELEKAIWRAIYEAPASEVLATLTGASVGLAIALTRKRGGDADKEIFIDGGKERNITIHAKKEYAA